MPLWVFLAAIALIERDARKRLSAADRKRLGKLTGRVRRAAKRRR